MAKTPYKDRDDIRKINAQWRKLTGLHSREEWSEAVVRAATAAEIAANFAIREEFKKRGDFSVECVNDLLMLANGLQGKIDRLLSPLVKGSPAEAEVRALRQVMQTINRDRNAIVHQGEFRNADEARATIEAARTFIEGLVRIYKRKFRLKEKS